MNEENKNNKNGMLETETETEQISINEVEEDEGKSAYFWFFVNSIVFGYNSYAITNNLCIGDGYSYVIMGLIINIAIIYFYAGEFHALFPKLNKKISYVILLIILFLGIKAGYSSYSNVIEETAVQLVTQILKENIASDAPVCKAVSIDKKVSDGFYKATATLSTGEELQIVIEEKKNNMISVSIPK